MKKILFVCIENSCRSQIAEAFARMYGSGVVQASSCGSNPSGLIDENAISIMREIGYDLSVHQSKSIEDLPCKDFDAVITMGCGDHCPAVKAERHIEWDIPDPKQMSDEDFREISAHIEQHVKTLLHDLSH